MSAATNRLVLRALRTRWAGRSLGRSLAGLQVHGSRTGHLYTFPVQYAPTEDGLVVLPGAAETKTWWRNLLEPSSVQVLLDQHWHHGTARVVLPSDAAHPAMLAAYRDRWDRSDPSGDQPLVHVHLAAGAALRQPGPVHAREQHQAAEHQHLEDEGDR